MKKNIVFFFIFWGFFSSVHAQENRPGDLLFRIKERGKLVVAMLGRDQPPFFFTDEATGELAGLDVELAGELANLLNVELEINREARAFNDLIPLINTGKADIVVSKLSRTLSRAQEVLYSIPYMSFRQSLVFNRVELAKRASSDDRIMRFVKDFAGRLGVIEGSSYYGYAEKNFPNATLVSYSSWEDVVDAVIKGEVLAAYRDELEIKKVFRSRSNASLLLRTVVLVDTRDDIAIAIPYDGEYLRQFINIYLDQVYSKPDGVEELLDRYPDLY